MAETKIDYYRDGKTVETVYIVDENGEKQGAYESYYKSGQLCVKCTYKDGNKDGLFEKYHENGKLAEKCTYIDGKIEGVYESYYENGQLREKCTYKNGKKDGMYERYDKNGQLQEKCSYENGWVHIDSSFSYLKNTQLLRNSIYNDIEKEKKEQEERKVQQARRDRTFLNARLEQINKQMAPSSLRQSAKRTEVAKFRARFPDKTAGK